MYLFYFRSARILAVPFSAIAALHSIGRKSFELRRDVNTVEIHEDPFQIISNELLNLISEYSVFNLGDCCQNLIVKLTPTKIRNLK